jgi:hypothetical protein
MQFESEGLFIGLVKFAFHIDGGRLFRDIFQGFFEVQHRKMYLDRLSENKVDSSLYSPRAYRMFGSHGLAIIALIDEFAFCSRIFNAGHIQISGETPEEIKNKEDINQYKTVVLTGSSERFLRDDKDYLRPRAAATFLLNPERESRRYPFIGIIRIKFDYRCLQRPEKPSSYWGEYGISFSRLIKRYIDGLKANKSIHGGHPLDCIIVDTYDNDELMVVAFSDSIHTLDAYLKSIRKITLSDLFMFWEKEHPDEEQAYPYEEEGVRHVCSSCHMSYGYDAEFSFRSGENQNGFLPWDSEEDCQNYDINCLIESRPGHSHELYAFLNDWRSRDGECLSGSDENPLDYRRTVTGGSIQHIIIPVRQIGVLHDLTPNPEFRKLARRIKLTLNDKRGSIGRHRNHPDLGECENEIDCFFIEEVKEVLRDLGISKIVRERLLSLLDLYNDCARNHLQTYYFKRLLPSVKNILTILKDFRDNEKESLAAIENQLNVEISALETAFYNRMHNKMTPNAVLEYAGGIQQFLQAFGFAYKEIIRLLSPDQAETNYSLIAGVSKESSMRTHTELNINHIIYPQLFCVTSWKEASNCTLHLFDEKRGLIDPLTGEVFLVQKYYDYFRDFIENKDAFNSVLDLLLNQTDLVRTDPVYRSLNSTLTPDVLKYSLQDYIVYHFAFQRDFRMMWRYYLKVFLQTPSVYRRRGIVNRQDFIFFLFRLLMVAYREMDPDRSKEIDAFIRQQKKESFDYLLSPLWFECFDKVDRAARNMCENFQSYSYVHVSEHLVWFSEQYLVYPGKYLDPKLKNWSFNISRALDLPSDEKGDPDSLPIIREKLNSILAGRRRTIDQIVSQVFSERFDSDTLDSKYETPDNVVCLMNAFLRAIDMLDQGEEERPIRLHSVPRRPEDGGIAFAAIRDLSSVSARLLADPIGGFIVPDPETRRKYYACRTLLYRTLWDWSYQSRAPIYP